MTPEEKISYDEMMDNIQDCSSKKEGSNSLSVEQLMQPRYMVIADYPGNVQDIGYVFRSDIGEYYDKFPAVFRRMPWYEGRKVEDMPKYVTDGKFIYEVDNYNVENERLSLANGLVDLIKNYLPANI